MNKVIRLTESFRALNDPKRLRLQSIESIDRAIERCKREPYPIVTLGGNYHRGIQIKSSLYGSDRKFHIRLPIANKEDTSMSVESWLTTPSELYLKTILKTVMEATEKYSDQTTSSPMIGLGVVSVTLDDGTIVDHLISEDGSVEIIERVKNENT